MVSSPIARKLCKNLLPRSFLIAVRRMIGHGATIFNQRTAPSMDDSHPALPSRQAD